MLAMGKLEIYTEFWWGNLSEIDDDVLWG